MNNGWATCRRVLCVRLDNMGDVLMSSPAMQAVKNTFGCSVTLLTSSMGAPVASHLTCVDEVIIYDAPWVKSELAFEKNFSAVTTKLRSLQFDAAIIFTVYSQNPLPAALLIYEAGIPLRLGYCRENPYQLLTNWLPDQEPYSFIRHQVDRDLALVHSIGVTNTDPRIRIKSNSHFFSGVVEKLARTGFSVERPWIILHPGVSDKKRQYPIALWKTLARRLSFELGLQLLITGGKEDVKLSEEIAGCVGNDAWSLAGVVNLEEFISLIEKCSLVISVNTSTIHIASAFDTPMIVLYALTNPQHTPWRGRGFLFPVPIDDDLRSKNEVIRYVDENYFVKARTVPSPDEIFEVVDGILKGRTLPLIPDLINRETLLSSLT